MCDPNFEYQATDVSALQAEGARLAIQAVSYDEQEMFDHAMFFYTVCCFSPWFYIVLLSIIMVL